MNEEIWLFAYGSLLWNPGVQHVQADTGHVMGWSRRFWQGSPDHRGTPEALGRVVTLSPEVHARVTGRIYALPGAHLERTLAYLDHRESGGYQRCWVTVTGATVGKVRALTYVALPGNPFYLGPADDQTLCQQIQRSVGPSGRNIDYYHKLMDSLKRLQVSPEELSQVQLGRLGPHDLRTQAENG